jgi:hypothetical protein
MTDVAMPIRLPFSLQLLTGVIVITFTLIFLNGFGILALPDKLMTWLGGAIFAEVVVILTAIYRQL